MSELVTRDETVDVVSYTINDFEQKEPNVLADFIFKDLAKDIKGRNRYERFKILYSLMENILISFKVNNINAKYVKYRTYEEIKQNIVESNNMVEYNNMLYEDKLKRDIGKFGEGNGMVKLYIVNYRLSELSVEETKQHELHEYIKDLTEIRKTIDGENCVSIYDYKPYKENVDALLISIARELQRIFSTNYSGEELMFRNHTLDRYKSIIDGIEDEHETDSETI